jgi:DNA-binding response OmpR family regulator
MTWEEIFERYWKNEDDWKEGLVDHLKSKYNPPTPKQNGFQLNENKCTVIHDGKEVKLKKRTFQMLKYIYDNSPNVVSREDIYAYVWEGMIVEERTIDAHVFAIRKAVPGIPLYTEKKLGLIWKN